MSSLPSAVRALPDGRDLLEALADAFPTASGWVLATGYVEDVEVRLVASGVDTRHVLSGRYVLAHLSGPLPGPYGVTLSRVEAGRVEVLAGVLVRARSVGVNACCLAASGELTRTVNSAGAAEGPKVGSPPDPTAGGARWGAQASAAAARAAQPEFDEAVEEPERGDLVQHFAFGVCEVVGVKGDRLLIRDTSRSGRVLEIHLEMLVVHPPTERDGKRLFRLSRRG
ncbi:MAG TPA: hypothetical protein VG937_03800 [Polyangiaceae bacterium]|jgi:hypothetical protein|nr:hypothetical protein [Polyangiaceae bacterium]